jgi:hypothetical protein
MAIRIFPNQNMKHCSKCNQDKEEDEFSKRENGRLQSYCKQCRRSYCRNHYRDNKLEHNSRRSKLKKKIYDEHSQRIKDIKDNKKCCDCGQSFPFYVMQFDHISDNKIENIANMPGKYSWVKIEREIAKCELVCANCHSIRTYKRSVA